MRVVVCLRVNIPYASSSRFDRESLYTTFHMIRNTFLESCVAQYLVSELQLTYLFLSYIFLYRYFSYEHFYVIYCKFWELDTDHDFLIDKENLIRYGNHALTYRIVDRIFSQVCVSQVLLQTSLPAVQRKTSFLLLNVSITLSHAQGKTLLVLFLYCDIHAQKGGSMSIEA